MYYDPYECFEDKNEPGIWRCESYGDEGECLVAIFSGPDAEARAKEYMHFQNQD